MISTEQEIEMEVSLIRGTHIKRNNMRRKLVSESNSEVTAMINGLRLGVRAMKANGAKQRDLSILFAEISKLENRIL